MTSLTVEMVTGDAQLAMYSLTLPFGAEPVGIVTRGGESLGGVLCRMKATGLYVQVNAAVIRTLPQREVREAIAAAAGAAVDSAHAHLAMEDAGLIPWGSSCTDDCRAHHRPTR